MKIKILETAGLAPSLLAMRLPMKSGDKSDSVFGETEVLAFGEKDKVLSDSLIQAGTSHRKHLRLIDAWLEVSAPLYWWKQFDTYRIGVEKVSESTMHTLMKKPISFSDFEGNDESFIPLASELEALRQEGKFSELNKFLPQAYLQTRIVKVSYEALRKIYEERKFHKLPEWRKFCESLEEFLPYFEEFIR